LIPRISLALLLLTTPACHAPPQSASPEVIAQLPQETPRPAQQQITFHGCPPEGSGPDPELNRLKNRVDSASAPLRVDISTIVQTPWPQSAAPLPRGLWSARAREETARYEGLAVVAEGYIVEPKMEPPEPPNCFLASDSDLDFHIWLAVDSTAGKRDAVITETTPRIRAQHPAWSARNLEIITDAHYRVRIAGWLMLDQMHPELVGRNRATLWEIHPITSIEVLHPRLGWQSLDALSP
jgi:hypothetical protein